MSYLYEHGDQIKQNEYFRKEMFTSEKSQVTHMKLLANEDAGESVHALADHAMFCVEGQGKVILDGSEQDFRQGDFVMIPHGVKHQVINGAYGVMHLVSVYTPPQYPRGTVHRTSADAAKAGQ